MGKIIDKIRQVFNLFLLMLLIAAATAVFVWFLTEPEARGTAFWMSMGFMVFALLLSTLFASRVALRGNGGRGVPGHFAQLFLVAGYFLFTIIAAVVNARMNFSTTVYLLVHVGGLVLFLVPLLLTNMALLKQDSAERREQKQGRLDMITRATRIKNLATDAELSIAKEKLASLFKLSESLQFSDPTPGPRDLENALDDALEALEKMGDRLDASNAEELLRACTLAERALATRNAAVLSAK
ncbi:MAG: hypothetical protein IJ702_00375 [Fretibacterium sp.]|nr:hypothetical protein [Fretibacterium sp.]